MPCPRHHQPATCTWPCTSFGAELRIQVGTQRSQGREGEAGAHPHTWQVVDYCCGFPERLSNGFQNILCWGPTFFGRAVMTQRVWPATHILWGALWAALQRGIGRPWLERPASLSTYHSEVFGPFLFIPETNKSLQSPTVKKRLSLSFGKLLCRVLTPAKVPPQVPQTESKRQRLTLSISSDLNTRVRKETITLFCNISLASLCSHTQF